MNRKYATINCNNCGKEMKIRNDYIQKHSGICMSCQKQNNKCALKHGDYKTRLYKIWQGLFHRRYNKNNPNVCVEWKKYENFKKWAIQNGYKDNLTIDRINNKKGYEPNNCQWITLEENSGKDKRLFNFEEKIEIFNLRKKLNITQKEMAIKLNVSRNTIQRLEKEIKEWRIKNEYI